MKGLWLHADTKSIPDATGWLILIPFLVIGFSGLFAQNPVFQDHWPEPNGTVNAIVQYENTVIIGGDFTTVGTPIYNGTVVNTVSGEASSSHALPNGTVNAVQSDGNGGWYIGGNFTMVGDQPRERLAHLNAAGQLSTWNPGANGSVECLLLSGSTVYVGGYFTILGGSARNRLGAVSTGTGAVTTFNPDVNSGVQTLAISGTTVYAGGFFTTVNGGTTRNRLAAFTATGTATTWNPNSSGGVYSMVIIGSNVYLGGSFTTMGGLSRTRLALVTTGGTLSGTWVPQAGSTVVTMVSDGTNMFLGGSFTTINGVTRNRLASVSIASGALTTFNPDMNSSVSSLLLNGTVLYAGGFFETAGVIARGRLCSFNSTSGVLQAFNPNVSGSGVYGLAIDASNANLYVGGDYQLIGAAARNNLAAIDAVTGTLLGWNPNVSGTVYSLLIHNGLLYVGGNFELIGGQFRSSLASYSLPSLALTAWTPIVSTWACEFGCWRPVYALAGNGNTIFVGGDFNLLGGSVRENLGAVDATTGVATSWNPAPNDEVLALLSSPTALYVGGYFSIIGGNTRIYAAAFNLPAPINTPNAWNPNPDDYPRTFHEAPSGILVAGGFDNIGGGVRRGVALVNASSGNLIPSFDAGMTTPNYSYVNGMDVYGDDVLIGGGFGDVGGQSQYAFASLNINTGALNSWYPAPSSEIRRIYTNGINVYVAGYYNSIDGFASQEFSVFSNGCMNPNCEGCMDPAASNYDSTALVPVTCLYCVVSPPACVDAASEAYTTVLQNDTFCCNTAWDGICQNAYNALSPTCEGCTDAAAINFDSMATTEDGSCLVCANTSYPNCVDVLSDAFATVVANDPFCCDTSWDGICQNAYNILSTTCGGCNDDSAVNYDSDALYNDGSCNYCNALPPSCVDYFSDAYFTVLANDPFCCNSGWDGICQNAYNALNTTCLGCTNPLADNYDQGATTDDGSCIITGCTNALACNYDTNANTDDGSCIVQTYYDTFSDGNFTGGPQWFGDTGSWAIVPSADAGINSTNSNSLRLNAAQANGTQYLRTPYSNWQNEQEWSFWIGRRHPLDLTSDFMSFWLYANTTNLESASISGYRVLIQRTDSDWYSIKLQKVVSGVVSDVIFNGDATGLPGQTDISWHILVSRDYSGVWTLSTTETFVYSGAGPTANECVDVTLVHGSNFDNTISLTGTGQMGLVAVHSNATGANTAVEFDNFTITTNSVPSGCTSLEACNYDPAALVDDGTCTYGGCTNQFACNYSSNAGCDDGSCFDSVCLDPAACNYDDCTDNACEYPGCTDISACNFNPSAGCDDGLCQIPIYTETFTDGNFTVFPTWIGDTGAWQISNADAGANSITSNSLRLNLTTAVAGTQYLSTTFTNWLDEQEWSFWLGRRLQNYSVNNNVAIWLFADQSNLESPSINGYRLLIGDDVGGDEIFLQKVTAGVPITILSSSAITNGLTDISLHVRVTRAGTGEWRVYSSTLPPGIGQGPTANVCVNAPILQGTSIDNSLIPNGTGFFGIAAVHQSSANARTAVEFDNFTFSSFDLANGCTDAEACNYDPGAVVNDGSCTYPGCLVDDNACNYNPSAGCDDGSCVFPGCTNPLACNYNSAAGCNDGSCIVPPANDQCSGATALTIGAAAVSGTNVTSCINSTNPTCGGATQVQDVWYSFVYAGGNISVTASGGTLTSKRVAVYTACGGTQLACATGATATASTGLTCPTLVNGQTYRIQVGGQNATTGTFNIQVIQTAINGCTDPLASNYNACATNNTGCIYPGCTNPLACNFNAAANQDDGSCIVPPANDQCSGATALTIGAAAVSGTNVTSCINSTNPTCGGATQVQDVWYSFVYAGGNISVTASGGTLTSKRVAVYTACGGTLLACATGATATASTGLTCPTLVNGQTYRIQVGGQNATTGTFNIQVIQTAINGCTDPLASNYNACATNNTGCIYPGCTNPLACNFNAAANQDDGSCIVPPANDQCSGATALTIGAAAVSGTNVTSCINSTNPTCGGATQVQDVWYSFVYAGGNISVTASGGTLTSKRVAVYTACGGTQLACATGATATASTGLTCPTLVNGQTYRIQVGGQNATTGTFNIQVIQTAINGCTDPLASNYNACATNNTGCIYPGCTNPLACNFNAAANQDDGSCIVPPANDQCSGATALTIGAAAVSGTNVTSCINSTNPTCGGATQVQDVWYSFVYAGGNISVTASGGTLTSKRVAVYTACGGTLLACATGATATASTGLTCPTLVNGQTYRIQVGGQNATTGTFNIQVIQTAINGCTDPLASNYNACATNNTGCIYPGCTNPLACNFNAAANQDDGSCEFALCAGCTDLLACNYAPLATIENGSCVYPGCADPTACNFDVSAGCDDGSCNYPGCQDSLACNFDPNAGCSGVACQYENYFDSFTDGDFLFNPAWSGDTGSWSVVASADAGTNSSNSQTLRLNHPANESGVQFLSTPFSDWMDEQEWSFWMGRRQQALAANNNVDIWLACDQSDLESSSINGYRVHIGDNTGGDEFRLDVVVNGAATMLIQGFDIPNGILDHAAQVRITRNTNGVWAIYTSTLPVLAGQGSTANECLNSGIINGIALDNTLSMGSMSHMGILATHTNGAVARTAVEFDNLKIVVADLGFGCNSTIACNYDPEAILDDGSCVFPGCTDTLACNYNSLWGCDDGSCDYVSCAGCTDVLACNFDALATVDDGSCTFPGCMDSAACNFESNAVCDDGTCTYPGCTDPLACNYNAFAGCNDGTCDFGICTGCMDSAACNFNALATLDDGSCTYAGCTDDFACNFNPTAGCDDGSCEYGTCAGCTDPFALNYNPDSQIDDGSCTYEDPFNVNLLIPFNGLICANIDLNIQVFSIGSNPDDFTYAVQFSDGSPMLNFTQLELEVNPFIVHSFDFTSCGEVTPLGTLNAYSATITAFDGQGQPMDAFSADSIYVNGAVQGAQTQVFITPFEDAYCVGQSVTVSAISEGYFLVDESGCTSANSVSFFALNPEVQILSENLITYPAFSEMVFPETGIFTVGAVQTSTCMTQSDAMDILIEDALGVVEFDVIFDSQPAPGVGVNLFTHLNQAGIFNDFTVQSDANGHVVFTDVPSGLYLARAIPEPGIPGQEDMVSTFSNGAFEWEQADIIVVGCETHHSDTIDILEQFSLGLFQGQVSGQVLLLEELPGMALEGGQTIALGSAFTGDPIPGVPVFLERDSIPGELGTSFEMIAFTVTNFSGDYVFSNLQPGDYRLYVDIPGLPLFETHYFEITADTAIFQFLNFYAVPDDGIYITSVTEESVTEELVVFPNPAMDDFYVTGRSAIKGMSLHSTAGLQIPFTAVQRGTNFWEADISALAAGVYVYQIETETGLHHGKIIKTN